MLRLITFLEEASGVELVLPVTPAGYQWAHEAAIETVTVDQLGDLNFFGGKRMGSTTLHDCLLPAQAYPFLSPGAGTNPWLYLEQLERWVDKGTVVRWMVSGTPVNAAVLLEGVTYREQDGTNDLYADITLRAGTGKYLERTVNFRLHARQRYQHAVQHHFLRIRVNGWIFQQLPPIPPRHLAGKVPENGETNAQQTVDAGNQGSGELLKLRFRQRLNPFPQLPPALNHGRHPTWRLCAAQGGIPV